MQIILSAFIKQIFLSPNINAKTQEYWDDMFNITMTKDITAIKNYLKSLDKLLIIEKLSLIYEKDIDDFNDFISEDIFEKIQKSENSRNMVKPKRAKKAPDIKFDVDTTFVDSVPKNDEETPIDWKGVRHGRNQFVGFPLKNYVQPAPIFFTEDAHNLWLGDIYRGTSCFLVLGGPSFGKLLEQTFELNGKTYTTKELLEYPGHIIAGVNNSPKSIRPNIWVSVDHPQRFVKSIFIDPKIQKFVPLDHTNKHIFDSTLWDVDELTVGECPNVVYYRRNERFQPDQFLWEDTINWGEHKDYGGKRSVMLAAIRILFHLGIRKVYLLGCDFKMDEKYTYHFEQARAEGSVKGNNSTYQKLQERFMVLKPIFDENGFEVYNCNPESGLTAFPYKPFVECIKDKFYDMPNIETERSSGLYDRKIR